MGRHRSLLHFHRKRIVVATKASKPPAMKASTNLTPRVYPRVLSPGFIPGFYPRGHQRDRFDRNLKTRGFRSFTRRRLNWDRSTEEPIPLMSAGFVLAVEE